LAISASLERTPFAASSVAAAAGPHVACDDCRQIRPLQRSSRGGNPRKNPPYEPHRHKTPSGTSSTLRRAALPGISAAPAPTSTAASQGFGSPSTITFENGSTRAGHKLCRKYATFSASPAAHAIVSTTAVQRHPRLARR